VLRLGQVYHYDLECYTWSVPTTRPRHLITETDRVMEALDQAARRWPEDQGSRSKLLLHLVEEGYQVLLDDGAARRQARLEAIRRTSGALTGTYGVGYLDDLREEWPS
jgi:hypothetical protein